MELFKSFACDCIEKQDSCLSSRISAPTGDFLVNPKLNAVYNGIYLDPQRQRSGQIFNLTVTMISAANFVSNSTIANISLLNGATHYLVMKSFMSPCGAELLDKLLGMVTSTLPQTLIVTLNSV